jgi:hypothetical protein
MDRSRVSEAEMDQMLEQLGAARERQQEKAEETTCENCSKIDGSTRLTVETQIEGRDLHFCAQCDRLLSTDEYHRWQDIN